MPSIPRIGRITFRTKEEKARYMSEQAIRQATLPGVQFWAARFRQLPYSERAPAILRFVQYGIEYVRDPAEEVLEDADVTLMRGFGDCDAKEAVFVALCNACGVPAVGVPVFRGDRFPHVMAAVGVPVSRGLRWLPADPTIQNSGIGQIPPYRIARTNHF
jgi:transglutaminase-like putative cysteine protease